MTKWAIGGVGVLLVVLPACLAVPIPVPERPIIAGAEVTPAMTTPIQPGVTTRREVIELLGEPSLELPASHIAAYQWEVLSAQVPWVVFLHPACCAGAGVLDVHESYALLVAFDANDRVLKFEITTHRPWVSVAEHALKWAEREGLAGPRTPVPFTARVVPPGESLLYILREGGFTDRPDLMLPPPEVRVNGKLLGGLRRGEYRVVAVPPGSAMVMVDSLPPQWLKASQRTRL